MKYEYMLWCKDIEANADKVWGIIKIRKDENEDTFVTVWGRRGKKLQTKIWKGHDWDASTQAWKKLQKGYSSVEDELSQVYPEFEEDLKKTAFWSTFKI